MNNYQEKTELEKKLEAELAAEADAAPDSEESSPDGGDSQSPSGEVQQLTLERDDLKNQLLRARAEFDNYRRRTARDMEDIRKRAAESLLRELLPVVDNLERALAHAEKDNPLSQGVEMVLKQLAGVLQSKGLEPIPAVGERFDPNLHEALAHQPSGEHEADFVAVEYERGYRLGDYVLRPSKVVVSSGSADQPADVAAEHNNDPKENRGEE